MKTKSITIDGRLDPSELLELQKLYEDSDIDLDNKDKLHYKQDGDPFSDQNLISIIFHDFSPIAFVRDLIIAKLLEISYKQLTKALRYLTSKNRSRKQKLGFIYEIKIEANNFKIYVYCNNSNFSDVISKLSDKNLFQEIQNPSDLRFIHVVYHEDETIEILVVWNPDGQFEVMKI